METMDMLEKWVKRYEDNGYLNGSLFIAKQDEIILNKGFGQANFEHAVPNKSTTKFRIGSLSKAFTSMAIFQLYEKRKLSIYDPIDKYLPNYPHGEKITIYHCLTHTSGIPNFTSFPDFWSKTMRLPMTLQQLIDSFKDRELNFEPGTSFEYSNSGYALLTAIIEKVSELSYSAYIKENICLPFGMKNTGCDDGVEIVSDLAGGYSFYKKPIHAAYADLSFPLGAYGLYSTTEDLFIWDQALKSSQLINKDLLRIMFTPLLGNYACGWWVSELFGRKCFHHFGDISGYSSNFLRFIDDEVTIIFLSNINVTPVVHLTHELAKIIFGKKGDLPLPMNQPVDMTSKENFVGRYVYENDRKKFIEITLENGELYLSTPKMYEVLYKFRLIPVFHHSSKTIFATEMIHEQLTFYYSMSGEIEKVQYKDYTEKVYNMIVF